MLKSLLLWLTTIGIFIGIIYFSSNNPWSNVQIGLIGFDILVGIVAWAHMVSLFDKELHKKYSNTKATLISAPFLFTTLIGGIMIILFFISRLPVNNPKLSNTKIASYKLINPGLKIGITSEQVKILQSALSKDSSIYPSGLVSGYFGDLTQKAIINFQQKYDLPTTGEVDQQTADKFNEVYGNQTSDYYLSSNNKSNTPQYDESIPIQNNSETNSDPIVNCMIHEKCGGGSVSVKKSVCDNSICCFWPDKNVFYLDKSQCSYGNLPSNNTSQNNAGQNNSGPYKFRCSYSSGQYGYDFGELTSDECKAKSSQYWASLGQTNNIPSMSYPTAIPTQTTTNTINTSACRNQYNSDVQKAYAYGGSNSVGQALLEMAQKNLSSCLSTGTVTAVGTVQQVAPTKIKCSSLQGIAYVEYIDCEP